MEVELEMVLIEQIKPRTNFLVYIDNSIYRIDQIEGTAVTLNNVTNSLSIMTHIDAIQGLYVKFIAKHERVLLSVKHGDYMNVIKMLKEFCKLKKVSFSLVINNLLGFEKDIVVRIKGTGENILCRAAKEDSIEIIDLEVIDKYELHSKNNRYFKIDNIMFKGSSSKFSINIKGVPVLLKRQSFKILARPNEKQLFTLN